MKNAILNEIRIRAEASHQAVEIQFRFLFLPSLDLFLILGPETSQVNK